MAIGSTHSECMWKTLDNPGWSLMTIWEFLSIQRGDSECDADWIHCKVEQEQFVGDGGMHNLEDFYCLCC